MSKDVIEIEIVNFKDYNPRSDRKSHSWFRLQNDIVTEPKFHALSAAQRFVAIAIFAEVSKSHVKRGDGTATIHVSWLAAQLKVKPVEIHKTIQHLLDVGVARLPGGYRVAPVGITTDVRTDITDERTLRTDETNAQNQAPADSCEPTLADPLTQEILRGVKPEVQRGWLLLYPDHHDWLKRELQQAAVWCAANPARKPKSDFGRFLTSWLSRGWERYRKTLPSNQAGDGGINWKKVFE